MSGQAGSDWVSSIGLEVGKVVAGSIAGFVIGLFMKKTVWRKLVRLKKWFFNDILSLDLLVVREYPQVNVKEIDLAVFDHIKSKFDNVHLVQKHPSGMVISVPPIFGNIELSISSTPIDQEHHMDHEPSVRLTIKSENPVRLGIRELGKLKDFQVFVDGVFDTVQSLLFDEQKPIKQSYAVCDITRTVYFVQQKNFDLHDDELGARIQGTDKKLTITISPISRLAEATARYHFD